METAKDRALYGIYRNEKYRKNAAVCRAVRDVGQCRSIMNNRLFNAVKSPVQNRRGISVSKKKTVLLENPKERSVSFVTWRC